MVRRRVPETRKATVRQCCAIGAALFLIYSANGRAIGAGDSAPAALLSAAMARGDAPILDRYAPMLVVGNAIPYWTAVRRDHLVSLYPIAPAVLALPFTWVQVQVLDALWPSWTRFEFHVVLFMAKNSAAALAALLGVVTFVLLTRLGYGPERWLAVAATALGSDMWVVGSQSLWQHGPAALALAVAMLAVVGPPTRAAHVLVAGLASGTVFACRISSSVYVVPIAAWVLVAHPRRFGWYLLGALPLVGATLAYNLRWFDDWQGGIMVMEAVKTQTHAVSSRWSTDLVSGLAGTLLSPSRGLFVYSPWVAVALGLLVLERRPLVASPLVAMLLASLGASALVLGSYSTWWAGWCFGPRYWTDAMPILAILAAAAAATARARGLTTRRLFTATVAFAIAVQAIGSIHYPSSWNGWPVNVDHAPSRLWSWTDSELVRGLREGPHPGAYRPLSAAAFEGAVGIARRPPEPVSASAPVQ